MIKGKILLVFSVALVIVVLIILNYGENKVKIRPSYQASSMHDLHLTHKKDGNIKWELLAKEALFPVGRKEVILEDLGLTVNQTPKIYLTSGNGVYEIENGDVTLNNPVELKIKDTKFTTNSIKWINADELITTDNPVTFTGGNFLIEGIGLIAHTKQQQVRINKDVKATFYR